MSTRYAPFLFFLSSGEVTHPARPSLKRPPPVPFRALFQVEDILAFRRKAGAAQFWVKWAGYSTTENSWEPRGGLPPSLIAEYLAARVGLGEETDDDDDDKDSDSSESEREPGSAAPPLKSQRTAAPQKEKRPAPAAAPLPGILKPSI